MQEITEHATSSGNWIAEFMTKNVLYATRWNMRLSNGSENVTKNENYQYGK